MRAESTETLEARWGRLLSWIAELDEGLDSDLRLGWHRTTIKVAMTQP